MLNNNEGASPEVPKEVKDAFEKYKNQITDLELEARRLEKFLAEKTIELSNTSNEIKSNEDRIETLKTDKAERKNTVKKLDKEIKMKEEKKKELDEENKKSEEDIENRETKMKAKERDLNDKEVNYEERNVKLLESIKVNTEDKEEIDRKKQIILEAVNKL